MNFFTECALRAYECSVLRVRQGDESRARGSRGRHAGVARAVREACSRRPQRRVEGRSAPQRGGRAPKPRGGTDKLSFGKFAMVVRRLLLALLAAPARAQISCPAGEGPLADNTGCEPCTGTTYSTTGVCVECAPPNVVDFDHTSCYPCAPDQVPNADRTACEETVIVRPRDPDQGLSNTTSPDPCAAELTACFSSTECMTCVASPECGSDVSALMAIPEGAMLVTCLVQEEPCSNETMACWDDDTCMTIYMEVNAAIPEGMHPSHQVLTDSGWCVSPRLTTP